MEHKNYQYVFSSINESVLFLSTDVTLFLEQSQINVQFRLDNRFNAEMITSFSYPFFKDKLLLKRIRLITSV